MEENTTTTEVTVDKVHEISEQTKSTDIMTGALVEFMTDVFQMNREQDKFEQALKTDILNNLSDFKPSEKMALLTAAQSNKNDLVSKSVAPLLNLLSTAQQNEMQERKERQKEQTTLQAAAISGAGLRQQVLTTPVEVLQGLQALMTLQNTFKQVQPEKAIEEEKK